MKIKHEDYKVPFYGCACCDYFSPSSDIIHCDSNDPNIPYEIAVNSKCLNEQLCINAIGMFMKGVHKHGKETK